MVSSFHPHSMCKKVERVTAKTGCTSCTKWTISFEVSGFDTETRLLQQAFQMNYEKVESWHGIIIIVVEKVFAFCCKQEQNKINKARKKTRKQKKFFMKIIFAFNDFKKKIL